MTARFNEGAVCKPPGHSGRYRRVFGGDRFNEGAVCKPPGPHSYAFRRQAQRRFNEGAVCKPPGPVGLMCLSSRPPTLQ